MDSLSENARNNRRKRNMGLAEKSWLRSSNGSPVICYARTSNSNKLGETQDRLNSPITNLKNVWQEKLNNISNCEQMWKVGTKGVQKKAWQCCKNSSLEIVWEIQPEKKWKMVWTCSRKKWRS